MSLDKEDYAEPVCPFDTSQWQKEAPVRAISIPRVIEKLDECYSRGDLDSALSVAKYWLAEAVEGRDLRGEFAVRNELMGIFRKTGKKDQAIENAEAALALVELMGSSGTSSEGTALVNAATVFKAFDMPERSLELFVRAAAVYEKELKQGDWRLGGLYNNMGLTLADLGRFDDARKAFSKALEAMALVKDSEAEQAVTYLNLADVAAAEKGLEGAEEEIKDCCDKAMVLLSSENLPQNGTYAFYCEKCAPVFGYYGYFMAEELFSERAKKIYNRD